MSRSPTATIYLRRTPPDPDYDPEWEIDSISVESEGADPEHNARMLDWVREDLANFGLENTVVDKDTPEPPAPTGYLYKVTGYSWCAYDSWNGDYDGGFDVLTAEWVPEGKA